MSRQYIEEPAGLDADLNKNEVSGHTQAPGDDGIAQPIERQKGYILDEPDKVKVAKHITQFRKDAAGPRSRRRAVWKRNAWWREGRRWVKLIKKENSSQWEAKLPLGMSGAPPTPNRVDRLCRRLTNTIMVDAPYPECTPGDDTNEAKDAAQFATTFLSEMGASGHLNMNRLLRAASDKSETFGSAFGWVKMDPMGDGWRPRKMLAHPGAQSKDDALVDPMTGLQADETALTERYLRPDGLLTDNPVDADYQWLPGPKVRQLTGLQVDFIPETCNGIEDCDGLVITDVTSLGELRSLFPEAIGGLSEDDLEEMVSWESDNIRDLLPAYAEKPEEQKYSDDHPTKAGEYKDSQVVVVSYCYYRRTAEYPTGCYAVVGGESVLLHRQKWTAMMEPYEGAQPTEECLDIPVAQARCLDDNVFDDPYGIGIVQEIGPADEIGATALGFELEHMFRAANPIPFIPIGSIVQPNAFLLRNGKPVMTNPQGKPEWEQVPPLSPTVPLLREEMHNDQNDGIGLQQAAQGVEAPSVKSGVHAQTIVQEALKAVMNVKDNLGDYYVRLNQIILEQCRAFCEIPTFLSFTGRDGVYRQKEWSRTDFRNTKKVQIAKGSFTMHGILAKQEMANNAFDRKVIDADDYQELLSGGISPILGVQDNPHLMRVRRQIDAWDDGPDDAWVQQAAQVDQQNYVAQQQYAQIAQQYAAVGQSAPPPPELIPYPPTPLSQRLPVDLEPMPAKIRHRQISRYLVSDKFNDYPPAWQQSFLSEYADMKNAAGIMTVPEVQAAQQAEKEAAIHAQQQQAEQQAAAAAAEEQRKAEEMELRRQEVGAKVR